MWRGLASSDRLGRGEGVRAGKARTRRPTGRGGRDGALQCLPSPAYGPGKQKPMAANDEVWLCPPLRPHAPYLLLLPLLIGSLLGTAL